MLGPVRTALLSCLALAVAAAPASAQTIREGSLIRDTEIENTIRAYAEPVFGAAGMNADDVNVHLLHARSLNAFVVDGFNMFIHTGLLLEADHAGQVIGVIAHETGHLAGGHVARMNKEIQGLSSIPLVAMLVGIGLSVLAEDSQVAAAATSLGNHLATQQFLAYSRGHESTADSLALRYLDEAGVSADGLHEFLSKLQNQEYLVVERQSPYVRTHPVTSERIEQVRRHVETSPATGKPLDPAFAKMHARMQAKLRGFLDDPLQVLARYKEDDRSVAARYARAIAYHRQAKTDRSLEIIDALIAETPEDPYFRELKGQVLFESGRPSEAADAYREAVQLLPDAALIRAALGQALVATEAAQGYRDALVHLEHAVRLDRRYPLSWLQMAIAYGRTGEMGQSALAGAEYNLLIRRYEDARAQVNRAEELLERGSPGWQRTQDIKRELDQIEERQAG